MKTRFDMGLLFLFKNEGIESNDPVDVGGKTIIGIASRYHREWFNLVYTAYKTRGIEAAKKLARQFYKVEFWNDRYGFIKDSSLAFRVFDFGVNAGVRKAVKIFQRAVNFAGDKKRLKVDGSFGQKTLAACNLIDQEKVYVMYCILIYLFYLVRPTKWKHLRGWRNRLLKRHYLDE